MNIIKLKDFDNQTIIDSLSGFETFENLRRLHKGGLIAIEAIEHHKKRNLRYIQSSGKSIDCDGFVSQYSHREDYPEYKSKTAALCEFSGVTLNSISRIRRGLTA